MPRVLLSGVKAIPQAGYGFLPRIIPWSIQEDINTGMLTMNVSVSASYLHAYPDRDGKAVFNPTSDQLTDVPVPVLVITILFSGEILEQFVSKEIITAEDWLWLQNTHGVTKSMLGIAE